MDFETTDEHLNKNGMTMVARSTSSAVFARVAALALSVGQAALAQDEQTASDLAGHLVPLFPTAADERLQGFVRITNHSSRTGEIEIHATDDDGNRFGPTTLMIEADETIHVNSTDVEEGNAAKGLPSGTGTGTGDWRLTLESNLDIEVLSYIRTKHDGFLTSMHDLVAVDDDGRHRVAIFNPGSNLDQVSRLWIMNPGEEAAEVTISGVDDNGASGRGVVRLTVPARSTRTLDAQALEAGGSGFEGDLGDGAGKWQLFVEADRTIHVMSLLSSPAGHLTNLSTAPANVEGDLHTVPMFPATSDPLGRQGFVRVINHSDESGEVTITAHDETDRDYGASTLAVGARQTVHFNSDDLETGNREKGLTGGTGAGEGDWRLTLRSGLDIEVLAYVRTKADGFLTAAHDTVPREGNRHRVATFNPASNVDQLSVLRLVNAGNETAEVAITGTDDLGIRSSGTVSVSVPPATSRTLTSRELESGGEGFDGELGDGAGKWALVVESEQPIIVMSLLSSPTGHLSNLSTAPALDFAPIDATVFGDRVFGMRIVGTVAGGHTDFLADGRFRETKGSETREGAYTYTRAGRNRATVVFNYDDGGRCTHELAFRSRTAGSASHTCDDGGSGESDWRIAAAPVNVPEASLPVTIPDPNLRAALEGALDKEPDAQIFANEMSMLRKLTAEAEGIRDLEGLQFATNLRSLWLRANEISNLAPIAELAGLEELLLSGNDISDLGPLSGLTALKGLWVPFNDISDLTPLSSLTGLTQLWAQYNNVSDLEPLAGLTSLAILWLTNNRNVSDLTPLSGLTRMTSLNLQGIVMSDLEPLSGMTELRTLHLAPLDSVFDLTPLSPMTRMDVLTLQNSNISDLTPLSGMTSLSELTIRNAKVSDLTPLAEMSSLTRLDLDGNDISDLTPLAGSTELTSLKLDFNDISDLTPLSDLTSLARLRLGGNAISDLEPLAGLIELTDLQLAASMVSDLTPLTGLTKLNKLGLWGTGTSDLEPLAGLTELTSLDLGANDIIDLEPLTGLTGLTSLDLRDNDISDLEPLSGLTKLMTLDLRQNQIEELKPLARVSALTRLVLWDNNVSNLTPLTNLTELNTLWLTHNNVSDLSPLVANSGLGSGDLVNVEDNPLSRASIEVHGPALRKRGVTVHFGTVATVDDEPLIYNDNVFILPVDETLTTDSLPFKEYAKRFYEHFDDRFDFLMFVSNLSGGDQHGYSGVYLTVSNDTAGIGRETYSNAADWGSAKLQGAMHFPHWSYVYGGPSLHEMMHRWANWVVSPTPHWRFSSAYGQLGGFNLASLVDLGDGRYSAGRFGEVANGGNSVHFSPIEMYLAGFSPLEDVPDLTIAEDGEWLRDEDDNIVLTDSGDPIFTATKLTVYTAEDLVAEHGSRVPAYPYAQRNFRAAAILLIDKDNPAMGRVVDRVSEHVSWFSLPGFSAWVGENFYSATRGRATITMDGLSQFNSTRPVAVMKGHPLSDDPGRDHFDGVAPRGQKYRGGPVSWQRSRRESDDLTSADAWQQLLLPETPAHRSLDVRIDDATRE